MRNELESFLAPLNFKYLKLDIEVVISNISN